MIADNTAMLQKDSWPACFLMAQRTARLFYRTYTTYSNNHIQQVNSVPSVSIALHRSSAAAGIVLTDGQLSDYTSWWLWLLENKQDWAMFLSHFLSWIHHKHSAFLHVSVHPGLRHRPQKMKRTSQLHWLPEGNNYCAAADSLGDLAPAHTHSFILCCG